MNRRTFLRRTAPLSLPAAAGLAGCAAPGTEPGTDGDGEESGSDEGGEDITGTAPIPMLDDPPDAVYLPGHRKSMRLLEPVAAGEYMLTPMLSYPHPFWVVTGTDRQLEELDVGRGVHLMLTVWDPDTERALPVDISPHVTIERADTGDEVASRSLWPMLSQEMGFHFGDNVSLPADGSYAVRVALPPVPIRRTGAFAGRFTERATATFEFTYDQAFRDEIVDGIDLLARDRWGDRGALEPMPHRNGTAADGSENGHGGHDDVPYSALPPADEYPGTRLVDPNADADATDEDGRLPRSGDAVVVATLFEAGSRLVAGDDSGDAGDGTDGSDDADDSDDGRYLLVSPRTPYNRVPLSNTSLRAVVERDGEAVADRMLQATLDDEYGLHYGRTLADVRSGDSVRIVVESPPQTARHQGYETAFFEMESVELAVPGD
ncbi:iron transporter [Natrinema salifodinae]|uniref:DUF7350 domain-containing protein n=1 Tax=Natrinema salifodinae TaxID=1202768 RepID=A0A1I0MY89_9EURY|nr:iron transporter [Natrinema salifodinae]SEV93712.1 hypothetical protein SAMN05216285_1139 [Natrinema salifodinae]